jgi:hypothetical protein
MAIDDWAPTLKAKIAEISGMKQVHKHDELPGTIMTYPSAIILPERGSQEISSIGTAIHKVRVTVFFAAQLLPEAYATAVPYIALMRNKIAANIKLDGTVEHCKPPDPPADFYVGPGSKEWSGKTYLAIDFFLEIKENETFTISA